MADIHLRDPTGGPSQSPRTKPTPTTVAIPVPFTYNPSDDGTDENLLILLHGLGAYVLHKLTLEGAHRKGQAIRTYRLASSVVR